MSMSATNNSKEGLQFYNSFTKQTKLFVPHDTKKVHWCQCVGIGDQKRHIGHARYFVSLDIMRRVVQFFFGYQLSYFINIMNIDDDIIQRARERYLIKKYMDDDSIAVEKVLEDCQLALKHVKNIRSNETDKDKQGMYDKQISIVENLLENINSITDVGIKRKKVFDDCRDILSTYLDFNHSYATNPLDNEVFLELARHYETEFHKDMIRLNVLPSHTLTRVSEYVPQIVTFIGKMIKKGYAYESNSSVYFNTIKFSKQHSDAKLEQDQLGDVAALSQDERALTTAEGTSKEEKNECDFVLWKKSKPGEPFWQSPWGPGRPGSHIGCIVVASKVLGSQFDIHTSDIGFKFPHRDKKIAQSKAYFDPDSWVIQFLHSVHLTIAGGQLSKSSKPVITIEQAFKNYGARQIRLLCLLNSWSTTLDDTDIEMLKATKYEALLDKFFLDLKTCLHSIEHSKNSNAATNDNEHDFILNKDLIKAEEQIKCALCNSINTSCVMENMQQLIFKTNIYMQTENITLNGLLLRKIAAYITRVITIFGLNDSATSVDDIGISQFTEQNASTLNVEKPVQIQATADKNERILTFDDDVKFKVKVLSQSCIRFSEQDGTKKGTIKYGSPDVLKRECEQALLDKKSKQENERPKSEQQLGDGASKEKKRS